MLKLRIRLGLLSWTLGLDNRQLLWLKSRILSGRVKRFGGEFLGQGEGIGSGYADANMKDAGSHRGGIVAGQ